MSDAPILKIEGLEAKVAEEDLAILNGLDLQIGKGEIHAIMGPNGSGKSTLTEAKAMGKDQKRSIPMPSRSSIMSRRMPSCATTMAQAVRSNQS